MGTILSNENSIQEKIKRRLNSGNACCHSVQNILFFGFAIQKFKDSDIQNHNFAVFLCGCETRSVTLREESRLWVFENRVLRRIFGPKMDDVTGD